MSTKLPRDALGRLTRQHTALELAPAFVRTRKENILASLISGLACGDALDQLEAFRALIYEGLIPPPSILIPIAEALDDHFKANGALSLDAAFELKPKQKLGHPISAKENKTERGRIHNDMWLIRKSEQLVGRTVSIEEAAGRVINNRNLAISEDALKKSYINSDVDRVLDRAADALAESVDRRSEVLVK